jgi:hypothetical protein
VGGKPRFGQIATYNPNTQQLTPIDNTFGWEWAANPTNTNQIAFRESIINEGWNRLDSDANSVTQVATFDGTNFQTDFEAPPGYDFHWSPNGEYIAYSTRGLSGENCPSCLRGIVFASVANGNTSEFLMPQDQNVVLPVGWLPTTVSPPTTCELGFTIASGDTTAFVSAIESANNTLDPDTICLADNGSYTLTSDLGNDTGLPLITSDITIEGNNATLTCDVAAPNFRLIQVESTGTLTLNDLTISNGNGGWFD